MEDVHSGVTASQGPEDVCPGVVASQAVRPGVVRPGVTASLPASIFAIDHWMFALNANEWPDYVMKTGHPEGLA